MNPHLHVMPGGRRIAVSLALGWACFGPLTWPEIRAAMAAPDIPVIDIHTHVFNARDLPLRGIIQSRGLPAARVLEDILIDWTPEDDPPAGVASQRPAGPHRRRGLSSDERRKLETLIPARMLLDVALKGTRDAALDDLTLVALALKVIGLPPPEGRPSDTIQLSSVDLEGLKRVLEVVTSTHDRVVAKLDELYPDADMFVHHMMDMARTYASPPVNSFSRQIEIMRELGLRRPGDLAGFVAFDPFRGDEAIALVEQGLASGALGVKFYPPSGYRAAENAIPSRPAFWFPNWPRWWPIWGWNARKQWNSRYRDLTGSVLDARMELFFSAMTMKGRDVPIFAHCTPDGFEAVSDQGYGLNSHPKYWRSLLARDGYSGLRLCLGHAGGDDYWFGRGPDDCRAFGELVVELCLTYRNVYCEVGYLEMILDPRERNNFRDRLAELVRRPSVNGEWKFGDRIMYGTDWWMIEKEEGRERFLNAFDEVISTIDGGTWRRKFFAGNAVEFLRLRDRVMEPGYSPEQKRVWAQIIAGVKPTQP